MRPAHAKPPGTEERRATSLAGRPNGGGATDEAGEICGVAAVTAPSLPAAAASPGGGTADATGVTVAAGVVATLVARQKRQRVVVVVVALAMSAHPCRHNQVRTLLNLRPHNLLLEVDLTAPSRHCDRRCRD